MSGNQDLINVSIALVVLWAIDMKTCRLIANNNIYVMPLMNCFEEVRLSVLQESTERIAGKRHQLCVVRFVRGTELANGGTVFLIATFNSRAIRYDQVRKRSRMCSDNDVQLLMVTSTIPAHLMWAYIVGVASLVRI